MTHAIGKGIIDLIQQHEPLAIKIRNGDPAARDRVLRDLADSIGGLLAFAIAAGGAAEAKRCAFLVLDRLSAAAPDILRQAQAELRKSAK